MTAPALITMREAAAMFPGDQQRARERLERLVFRSKRLTKYPGPSFRRNRRTILLDRAEIEQYLKAHTKRCPRCTLKWRTDFHRNRARYDGLASICKLCWHARYMEKQAKHIQDQANYRTRVNKERVGWVPLAKAARLLGVSRQYIHQIKARLEIRPDPRRQRIMLVSKASVEALQTRVGQTIANSSGYLSRYELAKMLGMGYPALTRLIEASGVFVYTAGYRLATEPIASLGRRPFYIKVEDIDRILELRKSDARHKKL